MKRPRSVPGDQDNSPFEFLRKDLHHAKVGFHPGEETEPKEGEHRFPRRTNEREVPRESLADRLRGEREERS